MRAGRGIFSSAPRAACGGCALDAPAGAVVLQGKKPQSILGVFGVADVPVRAQGFLTQQVGKRPDLTALDGCEYRFLVTAGVFSAAMALLVVGTGGVGVVGQRSGEKGRRGLVGFSGDTGVEADPRLGQGSPGSGANAAADQVGDAPLPKESCQGAVAAALCSHHLGGGDGLVLHPVELKGPGVPEMLEHLSVFIGDCDDHTRTLLFCDVGKTAGRSSRYQPVDV